LLEGLTKEGWKEEMAAFIAGWRLRPGVAKDSAVIESMGEATTVVFHHHTPPTARLPGLDTTFVAAKSVATSWL